MVAIIYLLFNYRSKLSDVWRCAKPSGTFDSVRPERFYVNDPRIVFVFFFNISEIRNAGESNQQLNNIFLSA